MPQAGSIPKAPIWERASAQGRSRAGRKAGRKTTLESLAVSIWRTNCVRKVIADSWYSTATTRFFLRNSYLGCNYFSFSDVIAFFLICFLINFCQSKCLFFIVLDRYLITKTATEQHFLWLTHVFLYYDTCGQICVYLYATLINEDNSDL